MMLRALAVMLMLAPVARADVPNVVTSIAPVQGIVADIMVGVGTPTLLLDQATSPHDFALRPSQLRALNAADIVFTIGLNIEPWLQKPLSQQSGKQVFALGETTSPHRLVARELQSFGAEDHDHDHDHETEGEAVDPHVWLHPDNALLWIDIIAGVLANADPENSKTYLGNADALRETILVTVSGSLQTLADMQGVDILVSHDSLQYFEDAFGLHVIGTFSASDGQHAGAKTIGEILGHLNSETCILVDSTHPEAVAQKVGDHARIINIDPLGYDFLGEASYYPRLLSSLTNAVAQCQTTQ